MGEIKKIVLAYSGGLDTSVIIPWLKENYTGCEVIAVCGDVGQGDETDGLEEKALKTGASKLYIEDLTDTYVNDFILPALKAGGPYTLQVRAGEATQTVSDVLVGDVWLCSGQSNMELQVWRSLDARAELAGASNDRIRLFTVPQVAAVTPQAGFGQPVRWRPVDSESVRDFSAACYFFARELQKTVDVPMGLP